MPGVLERDQSALEAADKLSCLSEWAIFCPGPSLGKLETVDYAFRESIAVNGAIIKFPVRYWAMLDYEVFVSCCKRLPLLGRSIIAPTLWVTENWLTHMPKWAPEVMLMFSDFVCETHRGKQTDIEPFGSIFDYTRENIAKAILKWSEYTVFTAIALAIMKGADVIRLYGADMCGEGYFSRNMTNSRLNHGSVRWSTEMAYFKTLQSLCAEHGIEIIREGA